VKHLIVSCLALIAALLLKSTMVLPSRQALALPAFQVSAGEITILDRDHSPVSTITDGDLVQLQIVLDGNVSTATQVSFGFKDAADIGESCTIPAGRDRCQTESFASLGWYWQPEGRAADVRIIRASVEGLPQKLAAEVRVLPRPVVMVHGFISNWQAWNNYLGPQGYLAGIGLQGFSVGDGQAPGALNTGSLAAPAARTNTIAENAAVLGEYIRGVKQITGAQMVDLISHSMGGLISRYYIDRVMQERDVAQLIMLGSPMAGTDCADLPAALGLYLPATLEIRPGYVEGIFNRQITHRHGVPFHALAGVPIQDAFKSPCTEVPTDLAVSLQSVAAIPLDVNQMPILHTELNLSEQVFNEFVKPRLQTSPGGFPQEPDPASPTLPQKPLQFTRLYSSHIDAGSSQKVTIQIDPGVTVASFALYDTTRSLAVSVTGASGNTIELSAEKNGLVVLEDPQAFFYLGYGFQDPKPGAWQVTLSATGKTPENGADYALMAHFLGGAELDARLSAILPRVGETVQLKASLILGGQALELDEGHAKIRAPDGGTETLPLEIAGGQAEASWRPLSPGLYSVDFQVTGISPEGAPVERADFLAVEVQPGEDLTSRTLGLGAIVIVLLVALWVVILRRRRHSRVKQHNGSR